MILRAILLLLVLSIPAQAQSFTDMDFVWEQAWGDKHSACIGTVTRMPEPPRQFTGKARKPFRIHWVAPRELKRTYCPGFRCGCVHIHADRCVAYGDKLLPAHLKAKVARHERAHCNGWRG